LERFDFKVNSISSQRKSCKACPIEKPSSLPTYLGFIVLILPKCPFCFVAYSSAMTICGSSSLISHHTDWGSYFAIGLSFTVLLCLGFNYRGAGTKRAIFLAIIGLLFVILGIYNPRFMSLYYFGSILLLIATFYNGSGFAKINKLIAFLKNKFNITFS
jgi:hypothetical protein